MFNIQQQQQPSLNNREMKSASLCFDNINPNQSSDNHESTVSNNKSLDEVESMETNSEFTETNQYLANSESTEANQSIDNDGHVATNNSFKQKINDEFLETKSIHSKKRINPSAQNLVSVQISKTPCQVEDAAVKKSSMDGESTVTHLDKLETNAKNQLLKTYKCKECTYSSKIAICVENHQKIHAKYKPVACELCKFLCKTSLDLENHKQKVHRKIYLQKQRFFCKHTNTDFHLQYRPADCEDCVLYLKKEAKNLSRLKTLKEQAFQCKYCVFWTDTQDIYEYHVKSHEKYKPLSCSRCNVWCENQYALDNHLKKHQSSCANRRVEIKLCCDICSFVCNSKFLLVQHRKSHNTVASNSCQKCGQDFKYRIMLKKHELKCTSVRVDKVPQEQNDNISFQEESDVDSDNSIQENPDFDSDSSFQNSESASLKVIGKRKSSENKKNGAIGIIAKRRKVTTKAKVAEKITAKERAPKKVAAKEKAPKRVAPQKIAPKRVAPQKIAPKRDTGKEIPPETVAAQKIAPKKVAAKEKAPKRVTAKEKAPKTLTSKAKAVKKVPTSRSNHNTGTQNIPVTIISSERDTGTPSLVLSCTEEPTFSNSNIKEEVMDTIEHQIELAIVKEEDPILDSVIENVFFELPAVSQSPQKINLMETAPILSKRLGNFEENTLIYKIEEN